MIDDTNDNTSFHDYAPSDRGMNQVIQDAKEKALKKDMLAKGIIADSDSDTDIDTDTDGDEYSKNLMDDDVDSDDFDSDNDDDFVMRE